MRPGERGPARFGAAANSAAGNDQETAALLARWREGYARLADLSGRQLALVKDVVPAVKPAGAAENGEASPKTADAVLEGAYDDLWFRLGCLAEEKEAVQRELERLQDELRRRLGEEELKARFERDVRASAEQARVLTLETARKVESLFAYIGERLGSVRLHRKAMHAYYGMDRDDPVPLYFDEKK